MMCDLLMVLAFMRTRDKCAVEVTAEHDVIYLDGPSKHLLSEAEIAMLEKWGCEWSEHLESWEFRT